MSKIKQYLLNNYDIETIELIANKGCDTGICTDLIYYSDTNKFHDEHEEEIWDLLYQDAEDQGVTIMQLIASFNGQKDVGSMEQFKNLLCWYAVEKMAFEIVNEREQEQGDF